MASLALFPIVDDARRSAALSDRWAIPCRRYGAVVQFAQLRLIRWTWVPTPWGIVVLVDDGLTPGQEDEAIGQAFTRLAAHLSRTDNEKGRR